MHTLIRWGFCGWLVVAAVALRAEEFTKGLTPEEFASAGLGKLAPAELARLNELVRAQQSGELARARAEAEARAQAVAEAQVQAAEARARSETAAKVKAETEAKVRAEIAAQKAAEPKKGERTSMLGKMRVLLTPGADIEFAKVETQIAGPFRGYEAGEVLTLTNGQRWRVVEGSYWAPARDANKPRRVVIESGVLGSFFLSIEDGGRPKVKLVSNPQ